MNSDGGTGLLIMGMRSKENVRRAAELTLLHSTGEMSQQGPEEASITFYDIAACFSEEEWKLLHNWQKELYRSVMKEIQEAFSSLGPLIATSIFSLRPKQKKNVCSMDIQQFEKRAHITPSLRGNSDTLLGERNHLKHSEASMHTLKHRENTDEKESGDDPSAGYHILNSDNILRMDEELLPGSMDQYSSEGGECSTGLRLDQPVIPSVFSLKIKQEDKKQKEEMHLQEMVEHVRRSSDDGFSSRCYQKQQPHQKHSDHCQLQRSHPPAHESGTSSMVMPKEEEQESTIAVDEDPAGTEEEYRPPKKKISRPGPAPGGSFRSWTWRYFVMPEGQALRNAHIVNCRLCCKPVKRGIPKQKSSLGTSCLAMHLRRNHNITEDSQLSDLLLLPPMSAGGETVPQAGEGTSAAPYDFSYWPTAFADRYTSTMNSFAHLS
ncbi:hypothetical protein NDU88_000062 [Pleurodeles waltl]|uniref:KRAB domain-containing protein n=1 Tax=Pleurodeles waltl TaxID=8319 RepID=A0AAV7U2Y0_PLEWA|nr:hypothetical protein NDU88_000062 [Pleurodeles waltl]